MQIDITGYITEARGPDGFQIKVTSDKVRSLFRDIQVSKEVSVFIDKYHYPDNYNSVFEEIGQNESIRREIVKCRSLCDALRVGDQVECAVFIVDTEFRNDTETHVINDNRRDIKAYAEFFLWLYPKPDLFKRLGVDSQESLKFRKQWFYTCKNREKCSEITGSEWNDYGNKWWISKNPKIISSIIWWIQVKTKISNSWKKIIGQENLLKNTLAIIGIVVGIISIVATIVVGIIGIIITIWFRQP